MKETETNAREKFEFLQAQYNDARDEIKLRIKQRDSYYLYVIAALGTIFLVGFTAIHIRRLLF